MINDSDIAPLLNMRGKVEAELQLLLDKVAVRRKAIASINETINLLRGAGLDEAELQAPAPVPIAAAAPLGTPEVTPANPPERKPRRAYDSEAINNALVQFGSTLGDGSFRLLQVAEYLVQHGLIEAGPDASKTAHSYVTRCGLFRNMERGVYQAYNTTREASVA